MKQELLYPHLSFDITLQFNEEYPTSAYIVFPYSALEVFGTKARIPVIFTVDGHTFRSSLAPMDGCHMMVFNKEMRDKTGYKAGDTIHLEMERDTQPRVVELPEDVLQAFTASGVLETFRKWSYSHQKEDVAWINDTKVDATRQKRITKLVEKLQGGS